MEKIAVLFERVAVATLMLLLMLTVLAGTVLTAWSLIESATAIHGLVAEPRALFDAFGLFVAVLVGIELLKILRHLLAAHVVNTALIVQTALIALCNKVITLNLRDSPSLMLIAVAALILALTAATVALRIKGWGVPALPLSARSHAGKGDDRPSPP